MALQVVWTNPALADLDEIAAYIARDSAQYAASMVQRILDATALLADFPGIGRVIPEIAESVSQGSRLTLDEPMRV